MCVYLHLPGRIVGHPLGVHADCLLQVAIESNWAKVNFVCEGGVPKQVLDAIKGIAGEEEHWLLCGMSSEGDNLEFPLWHVW